MTELATGLRTGSGGPQTADDALGRLVRAGSDEAFCEAYRRYAPRLGRLVLLFTRCPDASADVVQEVFERLWCHPDRFDPDRGLLRSYLTLSARSGAVDWIRREDARRRRERLVDRNAIGLGHDQSDDRATVATVRAALDALPERERIPILLSFWTDLTYREIALVVGIPEGTVKSRIRAAFRRLAVSTAVRLPADRLRQATGTLDNEGDA